MAIDLKEASLQYVTNSQGQRTAVVIDLETWKHIVEVLEDAEDLDEMRLAREEQDDLIPWQQVVEEYQAEHPDAKV